MPDRRRHRGPHPEDARLFAEAALPTLRAATAELSWLLGRGYAEAAALRLVGDHHQLHRRQRAAVARAACAPAVARRRRARTLPVAGRDVVVDGFNLVVTAEAALAGAVILRCADGRLRDLAGVHGTWRRVAETEAALALLLAALAPARRVRWLFDRPVSNSGRLAARLRAAGAEAEAVDRTDAAVAALAAEGWLAATADGPLLDRVPASADLLAGALPPAARVVDLAQPTGESDAGPSPIRVSSST